MTGVQTCALPIWLSILCKLLWKRIRNCCSRAEKEAANKEKSSKKFSEAENVSAYFPLVNSSLYPFPLLAYDSHDLPKKLLGWKHNHKFYDMTIDAERLLERAGGSDRKNGFSHIQYWPPENPEVTAANAVSPSSANDANVGMRRRTPRIHQ